MGGVADSVNNMVTLLVVVRFSVIRCMVKKPPEIMLRIEIEYLQLNVYVSVPGNNLLSLLYSIKEAYFRVVLLVFLDFFIEVYYFICGSISGTSIGTYSGKKNLTFFFICKSTLKPC